MSTIFNAILKSPECFFNGENLSFFKSNFQLVSELKFFLSVIREKIQLLDTRVWVFESKGH